MCGAADHAGMKPDGLSLRHKDFLCLKYAAGVAIMPAEQPLAFLLTLAYSSI
jgi:hypothetical protein